MQQTDKERLKRYLKSEDSVLFYGGEIKVNDKAELKRVLNEIEEAFYHGVDIAEEQLNHTSIKVANANIYTVYKGINDVDRLLLLHYPKSKKLKIYRVNY